MTQPATFHLPGDRYYDANHLWLQRDPATGQVRVGIDSLGLEALGELAYISLLPVGTAVRQGDSIGTLEAAKMTGDVVAPISGRLAARNEPALRDPGLVNDDPYGQGWLFVVEPGAWDEEVSTLVAPAALEAWVVAEAARYRDQGWID